MDILDPEKGPDGRVGRKQKHLARLDVDVCIESLCIVLDVRRARRLIIVVIVHVIVLLPHAYAQVYMYMYDMYVHTSSFF